MKKIIAIIGARPQFIKHAAIDMASKDRLNLLTIHTGQHYDRNMSEVFFNQLNISKPDYLLKTGGFSHGKQTGLMMIEIEDIILKEKPDGVLVYGDTNSTVAGALVAVKLHIPVFHVEAGLRSYNKLMPEEVNRVLTDHISTMLFATSDVAVDNLLKEGIQLGVENVGDVMYDMILHASRMVSAKQDEGDFVYVTLHRPYNVDDSKRLEMILNALEPLPVPVVFSIHPRTRKRMEEFGLLEMSYKNISFIEPLSYFDNVKYLKASVGLVTDSGGMQKEAYWLKKKCITIRTETEWVETLENGWNKLMFDDLEKLDDILEPIDNNNHINLYGDGRAAVKIIDRVLEELN